MKSKRILTIIAVLLVFLMVAVPVFAIYRSQVTISETSGNAYSDLPVRFPVDNPYLATNGFMSATGLDTLMERIDTTVLPHMVADDKTLVVTDIGASSDTQLYYSMGNTPLTDFDIITGYGGYVTRADHASLELGTIFASDWKGYVDTSNPHTEAVLFRKQFAYKVYVNAAQRIRAATLGAGATATIAATTNASTAEATSHTITLPASSAGELLLVIFVTDGTSIVTFPVGWTELFDDNDGAAISLGTWYKIAEGNEGTSVIATTSVAEYGAYTAHRITGFSGVPEAGVSVAGNNIAPDPPNLAPTWGNVNNLWLAVCGYDDGVITVTAYPAGYGGGVNPRFNNVNAVGGGSAWRANAAAAENPGQFTISFAAEWLANTICIAPAETETQSVTAGNITPITSGVRLVTTVGAGNFQIEVYDSDGVTLIDSDSAVMGAGAPNNALPWYFGRSWVAPYMQYYSHLTNVGGFGLKFRYNPDSIIQTTVLPNEANPGTYDGAITWGTNPAGIAVAVDSLVSDSQPPAWTQGEDQPIDVGPVTSEAGGISIFSDPDIASLTDSPLYPIVGALSTFSAVPLGAGNEFPETQIWRFFGFALVITVILAAGYAVRNHLFIACFAGAAAIGACVAYHQIFPYWTLIMAIFLFLAGILLERSPSI